MAFHLSSGPVGAVGPPSVAAPLGRCRGVPVSLDRCPFRQGNSMLLSVIAHPPAHLFWVRFFYDARRATFRCLGGLPLLSPPGPGDSKRPRVVGCRSMHGAGHAVEVHYCTAGPEHGVLPPTRPAVTDVVASWRALFCSFAVVGPFFSGTVVEREKRLGIVHLSRVRQMGQPCRVFPACVDRFDSIAAHSGGCCRSGSNAFPFAKCALNAFLATDRRAPATT